MFPASRSNQITLSFASALMANEWGRHRVNKVMRRNGSHVYFTYHLVDRL